jgi:hypothetical protein
MLKRKVLLSIVTLCLLSSSAYAKKDEYEKEENQKHKNYEKTHKEMYEKQKDYEKNYKEKYEKQKELPKGLEKKLERDGTLPPGWEKKLSKGQIVDQRVLRSGRLLNSRDYPYIKNSEIYQVEDRVFRVAEDTKMILEIFK